MKEGKEFKEMILPEFTYGINYKEYFKESTESYKSNQSVQQVCRMQSQCRKTVFCILAMNNLKSK